MEDPNKIATGGNLDNTQPQTPENLTGGGRTNRE